MTASDSASSDPATVRALVKKEREALLAALGRVGEGRVGEAGVVGKWSCKDLLGHCEAWTAQVLTTLALVREGRGDEVVRPTAETVDEWNEREVAARGETSYKHLLAQYEQTALQLDATLLAVTREELETVVAGRRLADLLAIDTYDHDREHRQEIEAWLASLTAGEA